MIILKNRYLYAVLPRGAGDYFASVARSCGAKGATLYMGRGTAGNSILKALGIGSSKKDVVIMNSTDDVADSVLAKSVEDPLIKGVAAVVGASTLKPGQDLLIIDAGTCITYEVIDKYGNYWGGNIAPGMYMRLKSLHHFTAKLPLVSPKGDVPGMGYDTHTAIRSGVLRGMKYEIEGYIRSMRAKYPNLMVFLTGGDEINFDAGIKSIVFSDKYIVPRGLNRILDYQDSLSIEK